MALENAMACRVHRSVKLGFIKDLQNAGITLLPISAAEYSGHELAFKIPEIDTVGTVDMRFGDRVPGKPSSLADIADTYGHLAV
jgi:L-fucose isomerase-like protein